MVIKKSRYSLLTLCLITFFAAGVRLWQIETLPPGYWYDEAHKSIVALEIVRGWQSPIYVTDIQGLESGYFWLLAGVFKIFGASFFATRYLSAFIGTLTVPLTFWTIQKVYDDDRLALLSAGVLSFLLWHVHWSRTGLETILVPFFSILLLGLVAWAWQKQTWWGFALSGAVLGLSQYTNPGARLLPLQALITFVILGARFLPIRSFRAAKPRGISAADEGRPCPFGARNDISFSTFIKYGLFFLLASLIVYAPLAWFFLNNPDWFFKRLGAVSTATRAGGLPFYFDNVVKAFFSLNVRGDAAPRHNLSLRPAFDLLLSVWMFIGLAAIFIRRDRWASHLILVTALAINFAPTIFSDDAPGFGRTLGASPMVVVLPALGMTLALKWRPRLKWIVAISLCLSAGLNFFDYFVRYPDQAGMFESYDVGLWSLMQKAAAASQTTSTYVLLDEREMHHPATLMVRQLTQGDLRFVNGEKCSAYPARAEVPLTFAAMRLWMPSVQAQYPQAAMTNIVNEATGEVYGAVFSIPRGQVSVSGTSEAIAKFGGQFELLAVGTPDEMLNAQSPAITLRWRTLRSSTTRYTTFVHLATREKPLLAGADGEPCNGSYPTTIWHEGEVIQYELILQLPNDLPRGSYDLMIGMYNTATGERLPVSQTNQREPDRALARMVIIK